MHICVDDFFVRVTDSTNIWHADLIVIVFWHSHALDIPFPIGYRREHSGELERAELRFRLCSHYCG